MKSLITLLLVIFLTSSQNSLIKSGGCRLRCGFGYQCIYGRCVKKQAIACRNGRCPPGYSCRVNKCYLDDNGDRCRQIRCPGGQVCRNGKCVPSTDKCYLIDCMPGYSCIRGACVRETPINRCSLILCEIGQICGDGRCVKTNQPPIVDPSCAAVTCLVGTTCRNGNCYPHPSKDPCGGKCDKNKKCVNKQCVFCLVDSDCPPGAFCLGGGCAME